MVRKQLKHLRTLRQVGKMNPFSLLWAGGQAARAIPGMKGAILRGFMINILIYFLVVFLLNLSFYRFVHMPIAEGLEATTLPVLVVFGSYGLWLFQISMMIISGLFSIRISLKFMGLWYESLARRVVNHFNPKPSSGSRLKDGLANFWLTLMDVVKELGIALCLVVIGLIPMLGTFAVFSIGSNLMGASIGSPYQSAIKGRPDRQPMALGHAAKAALGWGQMVLATIPFIGWILLPLTTIYQVIGFAYIYEIDRAGEV